MTAAQSCGNKTNLTPDEPLVTALPTLLSPLLEKHMNKIWTPHNLQFLLDAYSLTYLKDFSMRIDSEAARQTVRKMIQLELITTDDVAWGECTNSPFRVTNKGHALIHMLLSTPLPEQAWVDPRNREEI
jgi:predicted alpha-1,6-mannanase (GH76 family)